MLVLTKKDLCFYAMVICVMVMTVVIPISIDRAELEEVLSGELKIDKIIVDAGHGEPDGGAVSASGVKESTLNLQIAKKLEGALKEAGYEVIMTREDENNISELSEDSGIRNIKVADTNKRVEIANTSGANFMISIHMNNFGESKYYGWQTFYSEGSEKGKLLAECIQAGIGEVTQIPNNRKASKITGIKIVDKTSIPVVIVECGFLSNPEECSKLQTEEYQERIVEGIIRGIYKAFEV